MSLRIQPRPRNADRFRLLGNLCWQKRITANGGFCAACHATLPAVFVRQALKFPPATLPHRSAPTTHYPLTCPDIAQGQCNSQ